MKPDLVLNELSLEIPAADIFAARGYMSGLIRTIVAAVTAGTNRTVRTYSDFGQLEIAQGYRIINWRNDNDVCRDERTYLKRLTTKSPYLDSASDADLMGRSLGEEVLFDGTRARGLGAALWLDGLALSFTSALVWSTAYVNVRVQTLDEHTELIEEAASVPHASQNDHLVQHSAWLEQARSSDIRTGIQLWEAQADMFPNLSFCDRVGADLATMLEGDLVLRQVLKRLCDLNKYAGAWTTGPFDSSVLLHATSESEATLKQYGEVRTFKCPGGESRVFSWHVRCTPGAVRIHFLPDDHSICIGYIGPHLPTAKFS